MIVIQDIAHLHMSVPIPVQLLPEDSMMMDVIAKQPQIVFLDNVMQISVLLIVLELAH